MTGAPEAAAAPSATGSPPARGLDGPRARWAAFVLVALLVTLPAFSVRRPPVWDLPPQVDQVRLFFAALAGLQDQVRIAWLAPNRISYPLLAVGWLAGGAVFGPRLALVLCLVAVAGAIHLLAARARRPVEGAVAATIFVFSAAVYGGFFNFAVGGLAFAWLAVEVRAPVPPAADISRVFARWLALGALLCFAHVLWLALGVALAVLDLAARRTERRVAAARLLGLAPFLAAALVWLVAQARPLWSHTVIFRYRGLARLVDPEFLAGRVLGGLRGPLEPLAVGALLVWCAAGVWAVRRSTAAAGADPGLARLALLLLGAGLLFPAAIGETIQVATRWLPWAAVCAVLALPAPAKRRGLRLAAALALLAAFVTATAQTWRRIESTELAGFEDALAGVSPGARLLELDFDPVSPALRVSPWANLYHYAALERGAEPAPSYTQVASSLVRAREPDTPAEWEGHLRPHLRTLTRARLRPFAVVLVHAPPGTQDRFGARFPAFRRRAGEGDWVLWERASRAEKRRLSSGGARPARPGAGSR